jgi:L-cysteine/cystine lyase
MSEDKTDYIRRELSLPEDIIAVNAGSWGPLSRAARDAVKQGYIDEARSRGDDPGYMKDKGSGLTRYDEVVSEAKEELGRYLNCSPDEVAICDSSTTGMNIFMWGCQLEPGDEIIAGSLENTAARVPLNVISLRKKVKIKYADQGLGDVDTSEAISEIVSPKTRLILISDVNYVTGSRVDLAEISKIAHEYDALILADGIQAVGTCPVDVVKLGVDGYAFARHKFLYGPDGAGVLYVKKDVIPEILPTYSGVFSDTKHGSAELSMYSSAQRYEVSTRPLPVIEGGTAASKWIRKDVGLPYIYQKTRRLYNMLWDHLEENENVKLVSKRDQNSLLTFHVKDVEPNEVVTQLREQNIFTRTVSVPGLKALRLSIGVWNRESDINIIAETVKQITG